MHIILGALGTIVTILWLLHRLAEMGIDLGGLNPWLWQRRRKWKKQYEGNPIFAIESPMEATALILAGVAKADGDMSAEEKAEILLIFQNEFSLSKRDAAGLLISSTHLLGRGDELRANVEGVLAPSRERFTPEQAESAVELMGRVAKISESHGELKAEIVDRATRALMPQARPAGTWE